MKCSEFGLVGLIVRADEIARKRKRGSALLARRMRKWARLRILQRVRDGIPTNVHPSFNL